MKTKKVRKKRFNFLKFLIVLLFLYILITGSIYLINVSIKNIVILNNNYLTDEKIIETAKVEDYPSFLRTTSYGIKKRLKKLDLVEDVKIRKKWGFVLEITVYEKKLLYMIRSNNLYMDENNNTLEISENVNGIPTLINFIPEEIEKELVNKMSGLNINSISKISEIEYSPTSYDSKRFVFYMNDGNMVYITINKISKMDKYNKIVTKLEGHTGILYLDSGNYFEIKD